MVLIVWNFNGLVTITTKFKSGLDWRRRQSEKNSS